MSTTPVQELQRVPVGDLSLWERNPRTIQPDRFKALVRSLQEDPEMMTARPLIAMRDGRVIAGNMRLRAALELGWGDVPVVYVDIDENRAATWAIRDNVGYGEWADEGLAELLRELEAQDVDLELTGFASDDLAALFERIAEPEPPPEDRGTDLSLADVSVGEPLHVVETGDVWKVGEHLLVVEGVYDGWPKWIGHLDDPTMLLVPYPTPTLPLTVRAGKNRLLMVQPDRWLAAHVLDKFAAVRGEDSVSKVTA